MDTYLVIFWKDVQSLVTFWTSDQTLVIILVTFLEICPYFRHILVTIWTSDQVLGTIWAHFGHSLVMYVTKMCPYSHRSGAPKRNQGHFLTATDFQVAT